MAVRFAAILWQASVYPSVPEEVLRQSNVEALSEFANAAGCYRLKSLKARIRRDKIAVWELLHVVVVDPFHGSVLSGRG